MQGQRVYIDTNVFIYFLAQHRTYFDVAAAILQACDNGDIHGVTGDAVVAELLVQPYRINDSATIAAIQRWFARENFIERLSHDAASFELAAKLRGTQGGKLIDALHYATALNGQCRFLITNDHAFKSSEQLQVVTLSDLIKP
jgi:predicted nucleic acid-binding protein